jgi:adenine-specific DNA-methyltransferase
MDTDAQELLETRRLRATQDLDRAHRSAFGQFFTPVAVARYMASLFDLPAAGRATKVQLLDPGSGIGLLTAAVAHRYAQTMGRRTIAATCYELESGFQADLKATLSGLGNVISTVENRDFIEDAVRLVGAG